MHLPALPAHDPFLIEITASDADPDGIGWWATTWYGWLSEQRSPRTRCEYRRYGLGFRAACATGEAFADLLLPPPPAVLSPDQRATYEALVVAHRQWVADRARAWAQAARADGRPVAESTHNLRLAALASFYAYALRNEAYPGGVNPIARIRRQARDVYGHAMVLDISQGAIDAQLARIPATPGGLRDRAIISLTLYTGRRLAEIANLRCRAIRQLLDGSVRLRWERTKGGDARTNDLPATCPATVALFAWLTAYFGATRPRDAVVFPSLSRNSRGQGERALSATALETIAARWVGTSRFHALRHTFALAMVKAGANLFELSEALGHSNPATTGVYVQHLTQGENPHLARMTALYAGVPPPSAPSVASDDAIALEGSRHERSTGVS